MRNLHKPKVAILDIPQHIGISARLDGDRSTTGIDLSGATAPEESIRTRLPMADLHHIVPAPISIVVSKTEKAPLNVTADRRVPVSKYFSIVTTSSEIVKKYLVSHKDKSFENLEMLDKGVKLIVAGGWIKKEAITDR